ncbi:DNA-binding CsgD family transcriptional regulator/tetratricopeptide (TPR) repeat protein [Cryobacterium sp. MP_M5]|uniref:helix-turn-helix transcriptional regulator n=1 Tax=unclassified Cryobacterium TaxID=2649013 RepID=UPI0018CB4799|nr:MULTISPECIES: LuxR family transcriptional regulator [unclassified Cryobacterium]MBG6059205.1 DNA-binding CsgD family transcriptional regulator/tetratricopeptide (TPR) repeat protein [Cryobacterium sp. MP_M3]MEC5177499.1 DNA-binding CsgD family transcriptional regulator/tetratricopeptide (TPR) repeat protein [Cryobacterium sp. MP_M5]
MKSTVRLEELARIRQVATAPQESALLIVGEPGAGKTRLLTAMEPVDGIVTHRLRINPAEAGFPLSGLSAFVASFQNPAAAALSARLLAPASGDAQIAANAAELLALIRDSTPTSTLLLIDDLDLMDVASQTVFSMVATRLGGTGLRLVGTVSAEPTDGPLAALPILNLERLTFPDSMALVTGVIGSRTDDAVRRMVVATSAGKPRELTRNARLLNGEQQAQLAPVSLPFRVSRTSSRHPLDVGDAQQTMLARLSCAFFTSQDAILAADTRVRGTLEDLLSSGAVLRDGRYLRISDAALRARTYWSMDAGTRAELHSAAALAELGAGGDPGLAAWHQSWADAGRLTSDQLLSAAAEFTRRGLIWQAVELAERALSIALDTTGHGAALYDLSHAMYEQAELSFATRYARLGQRHPDSGGCASRLAVLRTQIEFMSSQQLLSTDLDDSGNLRGIRTPDSDAAANALGVMALHHAERWEVDAAREDLSRARTLLDGCTPATIEVNDLSAMLVAATDGDPAPSARAFERLSRQGWTGDVSPLSLLVLGRSLTYVDRHGDARRVLRSLLNQEPQPDPILLQTARYYLAENEILAGNQFEAIAIIDQLRASGAGAQLHRNLHRLLLAWYFQATGDRARADAAIDECNRSFATSDNPALAARLVADQGRFALMEGRFDEAIAFLRNAAAIGAAFKNPALLRYQADLIEAYVLTGRLREAVAQFREFHARSRQYRTRWTALASARAEALLTPGEASVLAFDQALKAWQPGDSQFELGRTLLSFADRLVSLGHIRESTEQYRAARMIFTQLGAMPWARKADSVRLGHDTGSDNPLLVKLAPDERTVAELVCRGLRNKEIATELFVSLRTVEVRLTRTYNKLGARSRSHLIAMLSVTGVASAGRAASGMN